MIRALPLAAALALVAGAQEADYHGSYTVPLTNSVLRYDRPPARNPVSLLQRKLDRGKSRSSGSRSTATCSRCSVN